MNTNLESCYRGCRVFVTGHTGFKGSWLCLWLRRFGARVHGYSLPPSTSPNHHDGLELGMASTLADVRDACRLTAAVQDFQPEIVFHLAAQPLVRRSYREPTATFETNVGGTVNLYEACRATPSVRAIICVTSDKAYENRESQTGYTESDPLGGSDPYSCSKACAELITSCYRQSYFSRRLHQDGGPVYLATARAGNVIGGGDWSEDRLVPDAVKATTRNEPLLVRSPGAIRPWQHVLEPVAGYLLLGQRLLEGRQEFASAWNFGPTDEGNVSVERLLQRFQRSWPAARYLAAGTPPALHETHCLKLDSTRARSALGWSPAWTWEEAVDRTARWYRAYYEAGASRSERDLDDYLAASPLWANTRGAT
jgi:CDP-glucose 4,6-dehydratase